MGAEQCSVEFFCSSAMKIWEVCVVLLEGKNVKNVVFVERMNYLQYVAFLS